MLTKFETKSARVKGKSFPAAVSIAANLNQKAKVVDANRLKNVSAN